MGFSETTCSGISREAGEALAGTASQAGGHLLVEHPGPWPAEPLAVLGETLAQVINDISAQAGAAPALIRRHDRDHRNGSGVQVFVSVPDAGGVLLSRRLSAVDELHELADDVVDAIDLARDGDVMPGWEPHPTPLVAVCTHAKRDQCCARLGRPSTDALATHAGLDVWETTHLGGHRFAATALALPSGVAYGRLTLDDVPRLATAVLAGQVVPELMRGRTRFPALLQVAEVALRTETGQMDESDVILLENSFARLGTLTRSTSEWEVGGAVWQVVVDERDGQDTGLEPRRFSCAKDKLDVPPVRTVVSLRHLLDQAGVVEPAGAVDPTVDVAPVDDADAHGPGRPDPTVRDIVFPLPSGRALDVACGYGRHTLMLGRAGWNVTALDIDADAVADLRASATTAGFGQDRVDARVMDANDFTPESGELFDLVLMAFVALPEVFAKACKWVAPGGRLVLVGHSVSHAAEGVGGPSNPAFLHDPIALAARATGARLRVLRVGEVRREGASGPAVHAVLVATNPVQ